MKARSQDLSRHRNSQQKRSRDGPGVQAGPGGVGVSRQGPGNSRHTVQTFWGRKTNQKNVPEL